MLRFRVLLALLVAVLVSSLHSASAAEKIKALIIDGQNNHKWQITTPILKAALESSGLFTVDVATTAPKSTEGFKPDFSKYGVVVSNYNGAEWPEETKK